MLNLPKDKKIILFDGVCNLCNSFVKKIIKLDTKNQFIFASLHSKTGNDILQYLGINPLTTNSIILFYPETAYYIKSTAALKIMKEFKGLWQLTQSFYVLPESFRDLIYDYIAKNRYKWFGKTDRCMIMTPTLKDKFLD